MKDQYWAIYSGKTLLCFTSRTTKKQCLQDHLRNTGRDHLLDHESVKKVIITQA